MKEFEEESYLMMSGIQHFCFCRRQWALIHIEQQWNENVRTAAGRVEHIRAHDEDSVEKRGDLLIVRGLRVISHELMLSGTCDVVEFRKEEKNGIPIRYCDGLWLPMPVEYKHGKPKVSDADRLQLCAQTIALEEMLVCQIPTGALYYHETRHREYVDMTDDLRNMTKTYAEEMAGYFKRGYTPKVKTGSYCRACSLKDLRLPVLCKNKDVGAYIDEAIGMTI